jgi:eukaryotic-like serine/threonine-protein kinase
MSSHEDHVGKVLGGRYLVKHLLGRGGMGSVYEAVQLDLARPVALKILATDVDPRRLRDEALAAAALVHPCIMHVTDFHVAEGGDPPFLVMELLRGRSLDRWLSSTGPLRPDVAARVTSQVLGALAAAHAANILHRDVKPANIFVLDPLDPDEPRIKLLDFGLAKMQNDPGRRPTTTGQLLGTLGYMAPEQLRGETLGPAADLYSTGICLYEMLCGRRPFKGFIEALEQEPSFPPDVHPGLARIAQIALSKDPRHRFPDADAMAAALRDAARPTSAHVPLPTQGAPRDERLVPFAIATLATVAVGAVGGAIALARRPPATPLAVSATRDPPAPSIDAAPITQAPPAEPVKAAPDAVPDAAAERPKQLCVCKPSAAASSGVLCQELETSCECKDAEHFIICDVRFSESCTNNVAETARTGDPCSGFHRSWDKGVRVDTPGVGKLVCTKGCTPTFARAHRRMAVPFTACRGITYEGQTPLPGIWVPSGP